MPLFKLPSVAEPAVRSSPVIVAVNNGIPGNLIQDTECQQQYNRLASVDGLNRCRPGIKNVVNTGANPVLKIIFNDNTLGNYILTDGTNLWRWNTQSSTLTLLFSSVPFNPALGPINACCSNSVVFFNQGAGLFYWDGVNWNTVSMPIQSPLASYPIWASQRLIYAATGTNNIVFGDLDSSAPPNFGPSNNSTTVTVKLDNDNRDPITGMCPYGISAGTLLVGQKSKLWAIFNDPTLSVANFAKQRISGVIGVAEHNTMKHLGNDVIFLSETGNGIFKASTLVGTNNVGLSGKLSQPISADIERINWSAVNTARAEVWQDLYILSVPIDGSATPNAVFVYSNALNQWQGIWTGATVLSAPISSPALSIYSMSVNPTSVASAGLTAGAELIYGLSNGNLAIQTKPRDALFNDIAVGGGVVQIPSAILTKAFSPAPISAQWSEASATTFNRISPYAVRFRFPNSSSPVNLDIISDTGTVANFRTGIATNNNLLQLPHDLPWDLDSQGDRYQTIDIQDIGVCQQVAFNISGVGDWRLQSIDFAAFTAEAKDAA